MGSMVQQDDERRHRIHCETPKPRMAKFEGTDLTLRENREKYGRILKRTRDIAGLNRNETADALMVDPAQISRWEAGTENPQTFRYQAHERLSKALLQAQAEATTGASARLVIDIELERKAG